MRPRALTILVIVLYAQLALGLVYFLMTYEHLVTSIPTENLEYTIDQAREIGRGMILAQALSSLFYSVIYFYIYLRKRWARSLFLVLTLAGLPFVYKAVPQALHDPVAGAIYFLTIGVSLLAIWALFFSRLKHCFHSDGSTTV